MAIPKSCRVHPSAVISPEVELGENVQVGPFAVIDGAVVIGDDCVIKPGAYLYGPIKMGRGNIAFSGSVLGEIPQHTKYKHEPTWLEIGDRNVFREQVTIHRGTVHSMKTVIGNDNFFMCNSHVAHDCIIGNRCIIVNGALIAGHCVVEDNVYLSGNTAVHQFCRVGRLAMLSGCSATTKDIPPFVIQQGINSVGGLNLIGMRRAGMSGAEIGAVRAAFKILFRQGCLLSVALERMEKHLGAFAAVREMVTFLRGCTKGINMMGSSMHADLAA